ncbi:MAG: galactokinase family protein [Chloroflexota bacterium]
MQEAVARAAEGLATRFGRRRDGELRFVRSPYRICPLGAHVDHQDGVVTGMAIDQGVVVAFAGRDDTRVRAASADFPGDVSFDLQSIPPAISGDWGNFLRGAAAVLGATHRLSRGVDLFVVGQLPVGGLSSSAAVAIGYLLALEATNELSITPEANVRLVHRIENDYVGLHAGVLDQSMILFAQQDRLLRLDCRTGEREYVTLGTSDADLSNPTSKDGQDTRKAPPLPVTIAVAYSGLSQALVGTGYNQRVAECREAATRLLGLAGIDQPPGGARLRDVPPAAYERHRAALPPELARRAAHYFGEQARVAEGTVAWRRGDLVRFGELVSQSGRSSIENYECGAPELIALYDALVGAPGVYGARFSGAGFRGACLALVDPGSFDAVVQRVRDRYLAGYPQYAETFGVFRCASGPGAGLRPRSLGSEPADQSLLRTEG